MQECFTKSSGMARARLDFMANLLECDQMALPAVFVSSMKKCQYGTITRPTHVTPWNGGHRSRTGPCPTAVYYKWFEVCGAFRPFIISTLLLRPLGRVPYRFTSTRTGDETQMDPQTVIFGFLSRPITHAKYPSYLPLFPQPCVVPSHCTF